MSKEQDSTGNALATSEQTRLEELEAVIAEGKDAFIRTGEALTEIRDAKLYRAEHATFDDYCRSQWGFGRSYAYDLIASAQVAELVSGNPDIPLPANAGVAVELAPLRDNPTAIREAWEAVVQQHGPEPTAAQVREFVQPPAEVVDVPEAEVEVEPDAPKAIEPGPRVPTRSPSTLASVTRAFNAALDDGWSLEEIGDTIETAHRKRLA